MTSYHINNQDLFGEWVAPICPNSLDILMVPRDPSTIDGFCRRCCHGNYGNYDGIVISIIYAQPLVKWSTMGWWFEIAETEHMKEIMSLFWVSPEFQTSNPNYQVTIALVRTYTHIFARSITHTYA